MLFFSTEICWLHILEQLKLKIQELYDTVCLLEEEKYDWEMKIRKQDVEVCSSVLIE